MLETSSSQIVRNKPYWSHQFPSLIPQKTISTRNLRTDVNPKTSQFIQFDIPIEVRSVLFLRLCKLQFFCSVFRAHRVRFSSPSFGCKQTWHPCTSDFDLRCRDSRRGEHERFLQKYPPTQKFKDSEFLINFFFSRSILVPSCLCFAFLHISRWMMKV